MNIARNLFLIAGVLVVFSACRKRDAALPDNLVNFETTSLGLGESETSINIKVRLSRGTDKDLPVTIQLNEIGVVNGTDYTISPAAVNNKITLTIPAGNNESGFTVTKNPGVLFDGDEKLNFEIYSSAAPVFIGITKQLSLSFAEIVAAGNSATIDGGGTTFPNKVFIDLSANRQTVVNRSAWDLGFYMQPNDFRVILNSSSAMMAKQLNKNDLNQVNSSDTVGLTGEVSFNQFAPNPVSLPYIDYPDGDLSKTAITAISATSSDNKVYIVNRGTAPGNPSPARGWKKIRVIRNTSGGYTLQHADISATSFQEINVSKDELYNFKYISFESGAVAVEPSKDKWDLAWTYFSNVTNFGGGEVPYLFQDIMLQNRNVQIARVMTSAKPFSDFTSASLSDGSVTLTWNSVQTGIGADWRSGGGPTSQPAVRTDRYYIIKDGDNNIYKLRFTSLTQNGQRGYPSYESSLLRRG